MSETDKRSQIEFIDGILNGETRRPRGRHFHAIEPTLFGCVTHRYLVGVRYAVYVGPVSLGSRPYSDN